MDQDLQKLVEKTQKGDKNAYGEIYKLYIKKIYRFIYYLVYERELTEDLTQLTFLKAWVSIHSYNAAKGSLQSYLFAIARNLVIDYKRRKKEISLDEIPEPASFDEIDKELIHSEEKSLVKYLLGLLDDDERSLVTLRYFEELRFSEISHIMEQNEGTVRVSLHRILKKLRGMIKGKNYGY